MKQSKQERNNALFEFIFASKDVREATGESLRDIKKHIARISSKVYDKWVKCGRRREKFLQQNSDWFQDSDISFKVILTSPLPSTSGEHIMWTVNLRLMHTNRL